MSHSLSNLLLLYAQQFEDQHAPQNMTIALREAGDEITRLNAEVEQNAIDLEEYRRDVERLRAALEWIVGCALTEPQAMTDKARAALGDRAAAQHALAEYDRDGGVTLEDLKAELKEPRT